MPLADTLRLWARRLKRDGFTLWFACKHRDTPLLAKVLAVFVVAYAFSPIDLIPDFIPVLGYLDDVILLPGLIWLTLRLLPKPLLEQCRSEATVWLEQNGKPRAKWGIVLVVAVWTAAALGLWWWLFS